MKKIIFTVFLALTGLLSVKAQSIGISGPSIAKSGDDIVLTFTGESSSRYVVSAYVDNLGSTYNSNYMGLGDKSFSSWTGTGASKKTVQAVFLYQGFTANESVTFKIMYSYNGSGGAGNDVVYKTVSISPPPPVVVPPLIGPNQNENKIKFLGSSVSGLTFGGANFALMTWLTNKKLAVTEYKIFMEASLSANFSSVTQSVSTGNTTFGSLDYIPFGSPVGTPAFTQDTYIRMKFVYGGKNYYSNVLFVPVVETPVPPVNGPTENQNQLVLSPGSNLSSFSISNPALVQYIKDEGILPNEYKLVYSYSTSWFDGKTVVINKTDVSNLDFISAGVPAFTQKIKIAVDFYYKETAFWSNSIEIPVQ